MEISDYTVTRSKPTLRNNHICFDFQISCHKNRTFAAARHVPWALNTPKMRSRSRLGVFRGQRTCLVTAKCRSPPPAEGVNSVPQIP